MIKATRHNENPILDPPIGSIWEEEATFNGSIIKKDEDKYHFLYRAISSPIVYYSKEIELSSIGHAVSTDGIEMKSREQFIVPEYGWEQFGCEDPRVTYMDGKYYIFYTAISNHPTDADGIKVAVATTTDFKSVEEKHLVTPFNAKAAAMFPEKINGKYAVVLSVDTDRPPSQIAIAYFDEIQDIWSSESWNGWKENVDGFKLDLLRNHNDQVEVGAVPVRTDKGWLMVYSYIQNYKTPPATFGIEVALLDINDPTKILGVTEGPILIPEEEYEKYGKVPNIVFPTSALIHEDKLRIHYGAADTTCCVCEVNLSELMSELTKKTPRTKETSPKEIKLDKFEGNPIIKPIQEHDWESKYTLNPAAIRLDGKTHILYRAMSSDDTSVIGYALTTDGKNIDERLDQPIYIPRADFEKKVEGYSGCEDPRLTLIDETIYMCYTAFDGVNKTRVAMTQISVSDFKSRNWNWSMPQVISNPTRSNKNTCLFPRKVNNQYLFLHRMGGSIWIDYKEDLEFGYQDWLGERMIMNPIKDNWDSEKIGIASPPIETDKGFLLLYHGLSSHDGKYRLGAAMLDLDDPSKVVSRLSYPILEPTEEYEFHGLRPGTVFPCGAIQIDDNLYVYYGAADEFVAVAWTNFDKLIKALL